METETLELFAKLAEQLSLIGFLLLMLYNSERRAERMENRAFERLETQDKVDLEKGEV